MNRSVRDLARRVLDGQMLGRQELLAAAAGAARETPWSLLHEAHLVRHSRFGKALRLCSIVPGKLGGCSEDCKWCAQSARSASGAAASRRMSVEDIAQAAENARARGASHIGIVNSGRGPTPEDLEIVLEAAKKIDRRQGGAIGVCASLGELPPRQAEKLAESPLVRYHHNLETSRRFFPKMVGSHDYDSKLSTLKAAKQAGLSLCSGGLFGLGETWEDRIDLAVTLRDEVQPDVVPLNFLCPIPSTPLEHVQPLTPLEILTIIAVFRLALPWVDLKIAGGRANLRTLQSWAFYAGATSCMIGNYLTTIGRSPEEDLQMFRDLDLEVVSELPDKSR